MLNWQRPKAAAQLANYLRGELAQGRWAGRMPGVIRLAKDLGTARNTVEAALKILEQDGYLLPQGHGKGRLIRIGTVHRGKHLRIGFLSHDPPTHIESQILEIQYKLQAAGFSLVLADRNLADPRLNLKALQKLVRKANAAAWVVCGGSREVLGWFHEQGIPVYALFGRRRELTVAGGGPNKAQAYREVVRELVSRGHRRIVLLNQYARRHPEPGMPERAYLEELQAAGITPSAFNMPDWEASPEGLVKFLHVCYLLTPPTAFLIDESYLFQAVKHQLASRGICCPRDVSLICTDPDHHFIWCRPSVAHIQWDHHELIRHILRWAKSVREGKERRDQIEVPAELVLGDTMGRAD